MVDNLLKDQHGQNSHCISAGAAWAPLRLGGSSPCSSSLRELRYQVTPEGELFISLLGLHVTRACSRNLPSPGLGAYCQRQPSTGVSARPFPGLATAGLQSKVQCNMPSSFSARWQVQLIRGLARPGAGHQQVGGWTQALGRTGVILGLL